MSDPTTIATYDRAAGAFAAYFKGIGPRTADIERALNLAGNPSKARVVEIGCGDGRDAAEIVARVGFYQGFDPSEGLLKIAREHLSSTSFTQADALSFDYPCDLDVVYAFASLLHVSREELPRVFGRVESSLKPSGIFYISTKEAPAYTEKLKKDDHGERLFYLYSAAELEALASAGFTSVYEDHQKIGDTDWLTLALKRI